MHRIKAKESERQDKQVELGVTENVTLTVDKQAKVDERYVQLQGILTQMEQLDKEMDELDINYDQQFKDLTDELGADILASKEKAAASAATQDEK